MAKVYSILSLQLLVATCLVAFLTLNEGANEYFRSPTGLIWLYVCLAVGFVTYLVLICVECARRSFPINFIILIILTLAYGMMAAIAASQYETSIVLCAIGATAVSTIVIMLLAKYSPFDITTCGCALCILSIVHLLIALVLVAMIPLAGLNVSVVNVIIASLGVFIVSLYLMYDTQLIMGGRSAELSPEEYILGAVMLYVDIIHLFQYMLVLFNRG